MDLNDKLDLNSAIAYLEMSNYNIEVIETLWPSFVLDHPRIGTGAQKIRLRITIGSLACTRARIRSHLGSPRGYKNKKKGKEK